MIVGCQAYAKDDLDRMLTDLPGLGFVRLTENTFTLACAQAVQRASARSIVLCNNYGSLAAQVKAALALPGVAYVCLGNEPYWEGVSLSSFAAEVYAILNAASAADRAKIAVACMSGTNFDPVSLLKADGRLGGLVQTLDCHPYDAYGTGVTNSAAQRYVTTHDAWLKASGKNVDVICTEFGWCTPPYTPLKPPPDSLPVVSEAVQATNILAAFRDMAAHPFVKAVCVYHYAGYDLAPFNTSDTHNTVRFNGIVHGDFKPKPALAAVRQAITELTVPAPPPSPAFIPVVGGRTRTPAGLGTVLGIPDPSHVVVVLDPPSTGSSAAVLGYTPSDLIAP